MEAGGDAQPADTQKKPTQLNPQEMRTPNKPFPFFPALIGNLKVNREGWQKVPGTSCYCNGSSLLFHLKCAGSSIWNCKKWRSNLCSRGSVNEHFHTCRSVKEDDKKERGRERKRRDGVRGGEVERMQASRKKRSREGVRAALENTKFPCLKPFL